MNLGAGKHHRQPLGRLGRLDIVEPGQLDFEYFAIKEQQRTLGLVLGRGRDPASHGEMGQEFLYLGRPHVLGVALAKMPDKSFNPIHVSLLGANAVMLEANPPPNLLQKTWRRPRLSV